MRDSSGGWCRWFDLVIVLTTDNTILYERLEKRGYEPKKISENVQCEIMAVIVEEARESYRWSSLPVSPSPCSCCKDTHHLC